MTIFDSLVISIRVFFWTYLFLTLACGSGSKISNSAVSPTPHKTPPPDLQKAMKVVQPFFQPMGAPATYDWLVSHKEPGQTFEEYINEDPTLPTAERSVIYLLPLGKFDREQQQVIVATADWLQDFYGLPVRSMQLQRFPESLRQKDFRKSPFANVRQVRTGYILDELLAPQLPPDAAAMIALTNEDLYPDESMNYVFGQASFDKRVGVWSLHRLADKTDPQKFLIRTLKIAAHETGHMFSIRHCTKYECVMSGSNYLGETDRHPLDACPECMAKIAWLSHVTPADRYRRLVEFCIQNRLATEAAEFTKKLEATER